MTQAEKAIPNKKVPRRARLEYIGTRRDGVCHINLQWCLPPLGRWHREPLPHVLRHSPDGFGWGYGGSGPADTALSILADYYGLAVAETHYMQFKADVVAGLVRDSWTLRAEDIDSWAESRGLDIERRD